MKPFDIADCLDSKEVLEEYLRLCFEDPQCNFLRSLSYAIKAKGGIDKIARMIDLNPDHIENALDPMTNRHFEIIRKILIELFGAGLSFDHFPPFNDPSNFSSCPQLSSAAVESKLPEIPCWASQPAHALERSLLLSS